MVTLKKSSNEAPAGKSLSITKIQKGPKIARKKNSDFFFNL